MKNKEINKNYLIKNTIPYVKRYKGLFITSIILSLIISILSALTPFITKAIMDEYLPSELYNNIIYSLLFYFIIMVITVICRYSFSYITNLTGMKLELDLRSEAIRKIDYLPVDYYSLEPDGKIVAKITSDSAGVKQFYIKVMDILNALLNIVIVYVGVIIMQPMLGLLILIIVPIIALWITVYRKKVHSYFVDLRETGSKITGKLNELITSALVIQDYNQEDKMNEEYQELLDFYKSCDNKANTINIYFGFELLSFIKRLCEMGLLLFIGFQKIDIAGVVVSAGLVLAIVENLDKMINPINQIFNNLNELEDSLVALTRVYMFVKEDNDTRVEGYLDYKENTLGNVEFKNIKFAYIDNNYVLNDVSFKVSAGQTVGIVGATGSGKSSLMNLLLAYNDYQEGQILIDGKEITKYNKQSYRKDLGIVLQNPALFAGTIKSNVTMDDESIPDSKVIEVLEAVGANHLIKKTEYGINMPISFRGENLSLGEKQLISFARILIRNPKILVLDEATANIDTETELKIKNACDVISKDRTTFIIAHRLSTIKNADKIIVLNKGKIVGEGKHEYLYNTCSEYKKMYDAQFNNK